MKKIMLTVALAVFVLTTVTSADNKIPLIGAKAPKFSAETTNGKLTFPNDFGTSWKILFSHPQDFTPVCTSELLELAYMQEKFDKLGVRIAVISTDDVAQHNLWKEHLEGLDYKNRGTFKIDFPIIEDTKGEISKQYGMLHEPVSTNKDIRGVFVLDPENNIRSVNFYPMEIGRNMDEVIRIVEALQTSLKDNVMTPANWASGDDVIVPYNPNTYDKDADNADVEKNYYNVGNRLWFKRVNN